LLRKAQAAACEEEHRETSQENTYFSCGSVPEFGARIGIGLQNSTDKGEKQIERLGHINLSGLLRGYSR
jgi:hypothetical protein